MQFLSVLFSLVNPASKSQVDSQSAVDAPKQPATLFEAVLKTSERGTEAPDKDTIPYVAELEGEKDNASHATTKQTKDSEMGSDPLATGRAASHDGLPSTTDPEKAQLFNDQSLKGPAASHSQDIGRNEQIQAAPEKLPHPAPATSVPEPKKRDVGSVKPKQTNRIPTEAETVFTAHVSGQHNAGADAAPRANALNQASPRIPVQQSAQGQAAGRVSTVKTVSPTLDMQASGGEGGAAKSIGAAVTPQVEQPLPSKTQDIQGHVQQSTPAADIQRKATELQSPRYEMKLPTAPQQSEPPRGAERPPAQPGPLPTPEEPMPKNGLSNTATAALETGSKGRAAEVNAQPAPLSEVGAQRFDAASHVSHGKRNAITMPDTDIGPQFEALHRAKREIVPLKAPASPAQQPRASHEASVTFSVTATSANGSSGLSDREVRVALRNAQTSPAAGSVQILPTPNIDPTAQGHLETRSERQTQALPAAEQPISAPRQTAHGMPKMPVAQIAVTQPNALQDEKKHALSLDGALLDEVEVSLAGAETRSVNGSQTVLPHNFRPADMASHIGRQMADALQLRSDRPVELTLNPEELGRVRMTLATGEGAVTLVITADRIETLDLMRRHIEQLSQAFGDLGFENMTFTFAQNANDSDAGEGGAGAEPDSQTDGSETLNSPGTEPVVHLNLGPVSGLDVRI